MNPAAPPASLARGSLRVYHRASYAMDIATAQPNGSCPVTPA
jgi:hypothetical protein